MKRLIAFTSVLGLVCVAGCSGATAPSPNTPVTASTFVGVWQNVDQHTQSIPQLQIRLDGATIYVHAWGACIPSWCDWGEASAPAADAATGTFTVNYSSSNGIVTISERLTLTLATANGPLNAALFTHFTDARPDINEQESFTKGS